MKKTKKSILSKVLWFVIALCTMGGIFSLVSPQKIHAEELSLFDGGGDSVYIEESKFQGVNPGSTLCITYEDDTPDGSETILIKVGDNELASLEVPETSGYKEYVISEEFLQKINGDVEITSNGEALYFFEVKIVLSKKTVADILPEDFPKTKESGWLSSDTNKVAYISSQSLRFEIKNDSTTFYPLSLDSDLKFLNGKYTCHISEPDCTCAFIMKDNKLSSIEITSGFRPGVDGTYLAPATIADVLPEDFPAQKVGGWKNDKGSYIYCDSNSFYVDSGEFQIEVDKTKKLELTNGGTEYIYYHDDGITSLSFKMTEGELTSIFVGGYSSSAFYGTYKPIDYTKYCLFGYINGAEYGYKTDQAFVGCEFDENGKQIVQFYEDSYIGVKTTDNQNWFKSDSYVAPPTTSGVLKKTDNPDNLQFINVPGEASGVSLEFTIADLGDGTFSLSYKILKSVADILPDDFPITNTDGWKNSEDADVTLYNKEGVLTASNSGIVDYPLNVFVTLNTLLTEAENKYFYSKENASITFNMDGSTIKSIEISGLGGAYIVVNGTYNGSATIEDILPEDFPTERNGNSWINTSDTTKVICVGDAGAPKGLFLNFENVKQPSYYFAAYYDSILEEDDGNYKYHIDNTDITFVMEDDALTSIIFNSTDKAELNGTYVSVGSGTQEDPWKIGPSNDISGVTAYLSSGTLYINGQGPMDSNRYQRWPWGSSKESITSIEISEGVTLLGDYAFISFSNLESVSIPNTMESIGACAFDSCTNLTNITLPESITYIDEEAFYGCEQLNTVVCKAVNIPDIEDDVFYDCGEELVIKVPASAAQSYKTAWSDYADNIEAFYTVSDILGTTEFPAKKAAWVNSMGFKAYEEENMLFINNEKISLKTIAEADGNNYKVVITDITLPDKIITFNMTSGVLTSVDYNDPYMFMASGTYKAVTLVTKPTKDSTKYVYNGNEQTYQVAANDAYEVSDNITQTAVGTYKITISLVNTNYYKWDDGSADYLEYDFVIAKAPLTITAKSKTIKYNEDPANDGVSYEGFINNETASVLGGTLTYAYTYTKGDNAGTYDITPSGLTSDNYDITFVKGTLTVDKIEVDKPALDTTNFVYTGSALTYTVAANDLYEVTNNVQTNAGTYTVKVAIKDKTNYEWKDGTTADLEYKFVINQKANDVVVKDAETNEVIENPNVMIIDADNGIDPDAVFVVKVMNVKKSDDVEETEDALKDADKVSRKEKIYGVYDAKLLVNDVEIQPNGTITIKMVIPEEVNGIDFKLYHIHKDLDTGAISVLEVSNANINESDGTLTFQTDKLSQFAFVAEKGAGCWIHWLLVEILVICAVLFVCFCFVFKKGLYALVTVLVGLVTTIVVSIFGNCVVCTIFTIIDFVALIAGLVYLLLTSYKKQTVEVWEAVQTKVEDIIKSFKKEKKEEIEVKPVEVKPAEVKETKTLKESLAVAATSGVKGTVGKAAIADYLEKTYGNEVEVNRRASVTKPGRGKTEGLPLADTHYTLANNARKCFVYVYETNGSTLLLVKASNKYGEFLKKEHKLVSLSAFPKTRDGIDWYSVAVDDSWTEEAIYKMLDDVKKLNEDPNYNFLEGNDNKKTLKESLAVAATSGVKGTVGKAAIADYLEKTYGNEVEVNRRASVTKPGRGKTEGLPLADTHYTLANNARKCFVYVYETNGSTLLLVKASNKYGEFLKKEHKLVSLSAFPKTRDGIDWYSVAVDDSWAEEGIYKMLDDVKKLNEDPNHEVKKEPTVKIVKKVSVDEVNKLMTDKEATKRTTIGKREADKSRKTMVNVDTLSEYFKDGETVTIEELKKRVPNFDKKATYYKVCARGTLNKKLILDVDDISLEAEKMILLTGGKIILSVNKKTSKF